MSQWKNTDSAANSVLWATTAVNKTPNTVNQSALYGNTTQDAWSDNGAAMKKAVGQFGMDTTEATAARAAGLPRSAHAGWNLRTVGSGGRAGRVQYECLVAFGSLTGDGSDDSTLPDVGLYFALQPDDFISANAIANDVVTFHSQAASSPTGASITYQWQKWNGSAFANLSNAGAYSNTTTASLTVLANVASTGEIYRAAAIASGALNAYSSNAEIEVTTYALSIGTNPSNASANATNNGVATFSVVASSTPAGATLSYQWQKWNGSAFANLSNAGAYSNTTTATLSVKANTASNGEIYRAEVLGNLGATPVFSANATITITT